MIEQELLLLGLLRQNPKHGYEIKKEIKDILSILGLDLKSIYYPLRVLEKKGLVKNKIGKLGRRPVRMVYELTHKGKARFKALLTKSLLDFTRPMFSVDVSLYFLDYLEPQVVKRRLRARIFILRQLARDLGQTIQSFQKKKPYSWTAILRHNFKMLEAEIEFLDSLIKTK